MQFRRYARGQNDRHTNTQTYILLCPIGSGVELIPLSRFDGIPDCGRQTHRHTVSGLRETKDFVYFLVYCFFLYYVCFYLRVNKDEYKVCRTL